jgi:hypothetical protein
MGQAAELKTILQPGQAEAQKEKLITRHPAAAGKTRKNKRSFSSFPDFVFSWWKRFFRKRKKISI